ncbi:MAG TPA: hypothetical protein VK947_02070 [Planococcus sp. (in: firmicutes)]|nr:hypothetical protein [Planococcus sp. (in: firmicutes)]
MKNRKNILIVVITILLILIITVIASISFKEPTLGKVLATNSEDFKSFEFVKHGEDLSEWQSTDKSQFDELINFLENYEVEKMDNTEWNSDVSKEEGFVVSIHSQESSLVASIYKERLVIYEDGGYYYYIKNGPIDMQWIQEFDNQSLQ